MTVIAALKFFHYLGLFLAGGLGVANGLLAKSHAKSGIAPAAPVQATMMTLARLGLAAIILLWITGLGLQHTIYPGGGLGWAFSMKLIGATILLLTIAYLNFHLTTSAKAGKPPHPTVMKMAPMLSRGALVLVLAGIAITTSS